MSCPTVALKLWLWAPTIYLSLYEGAWILVTSYATFWFRKPLRTQHQKDTKHQLPGDPAAGDSLLDMRVYWGRFYLFYRVCWRPCQISHSFCPYCGLQNVESAARSCKHNPFLYTLVVNWHIAQQLLLSIHVACTHFVNTVLAFLWIKSPKANAKLPEIKTRLPYWRQS